MKFFFFFLLVAPPTLTSHCEIGCETDGCLIIIIIIIGEVFL